MRKIKLPLQIKFHGALNGIELDDGEPLNVTNEFENIDQIEEKEEIKICRDNAYKVIFAAIIIERKINNILLKYLFDDITQKNEKVEFCRHDIFESTGLQFSFKRKLLKKLINNKELIEGKKKNDLDGYLKKIESWRNIFAHGYFNYSSEKGICIECFLQEKKELIPLNDNFWAEFENVYIATDNIFSVINDKMNV